MNTHSGRPVIGITFAALPASRQDYWKARATAARYARPLEACGAHVIALRPGASRLDITGLDGLLLSGGGDLEARHFGQPQHSKTNPPDRERDEFELSLTAAALSAGIPILGICRGAQVLGVALGGQLVQDLDSEWPRAAKHRPEGNEGIVRHWVRVVEGSRLAGIFDAVRVCVNSFHHQANTHLGPEVVGTAWASDKVIEAIEAQACGFVVGVQWHPEQMWQTSPRQRRLFAAFVAACQAVRPGDRG